MSSKAVQRAMDDSGEMDMTPMIDIVFNLLIFFMVVTDLSQKELADLTLPLAHMAQEDKDNDPDDRVILNVDKNGEIKYRGRTVNLDELGTVLATALRNYNRKMAEDGKSGSEDIGNGIKASKLFVLLRADRDTPWQHVQWLMTIMSEQKLYKMQFATKRFTDGFYNKEDSKMLAGKVQGEEES